MAVVENRAALQRARCPSHHLAGCPAAPRRPRRPCMALDRFTRGIPAHRHATSSNTRPVTTVQVEITQRRWRTGSPPSTAASVAISRVPAGPGCVRAVHHRQAGCMPQGSQQAPGPPFRIAAVGRLNSSVALPLYGRPSSHHPAPGAGRPPGRLPPPPCPCLAHSGDPPQPRQRAAAAATCSDDHIYSPIVTGEQILRLGVYV